MLLRYLSVGVCICLSSVSTIAAQAVYDSGIVDGNRPGPAVEVSADIRGAERLFLVVTPGDDGYACDWCDWIDPKLVGENETKSLVEIPWKTALAGWGSVQVNKNCTGQPLNVGGKVADRGIGTHAPSVIEFVLPAGHSFTEFTATAGLDAGGVRQNSPPVTSVRFLVFTKRPPKNFWTTLIEDPDIDHSPESALKQFAVHPELKVELFAAEPMVMNPTNIDVDHLGRVWVCEAVNYRNQIRNGDMQQREEGDRISVLEDSDGDGHADKQTVFYQGHEIDSPHGICVLGNRVLVSVGDKVLSFVDTNGDLRPDDNSILFSGIGGTQHDHGIHAFVFGPDGKLYFNFGNEGRQLLDGKGKPVIDRSGHEVRPDRPYQQGMVFRCNLDGSQLETLAWNFRNPWEVCVDSWGRIWQSDNDDDGNRSVRINLVLPFGNYGYCDEISGAGWQAGRTGLEEKIPDRHWHLNDPGVVPNLIVTGAGSPTGILFYEGELLPPVFHQQIVHADAGPNVVRAYPIADSGAGYLARIENMIDGSTGNKWFRPSDVCVAPDGSLILADWYDPGVGGHRMQDPGRGRLYRVVSKSNTSEIIKALPDFETPDGAVAALCSPNQATRYLATQALTKLGDSSIAPLLKLAANRERPWLAARAMWVLSAMNLDRPVVEQILLQAASDESESIRALVVRIASQHADSSFARKIWDSVNLADPSSHVRAELAISLSHRTTGFMDPAERAKKWSAIAETFQSGDRWLLEALGIGAEGNWDRCLEALGKRPGLNQAAWREIVWRSRADATPGLLVELLRLPDTTAKVALRYFRSMDFLDAEQVGSSVRELLSDWTSGNPEKDRIVFAECLARMPAHNLTADEKQRIARLLPSLEGTDDFVKAVTRFELAEHYPEVLQLAIENPDPQLASSAIRSLLDLKQNDLLLNTLNEFRDAESAGFVALVTAMKTSGDGRAAWLLGRYGREAANNLESRRMAIRAMGQIRQGSQELLKWVEAGEYDRSLEPVIAAALFSSPMPDIRERAHSLFPGAVGVNQRPRPDADQLLTIAGDPVRGKKIFESEPAQCSKCHLVNGAGRAVGPDLSEIGNKLSREAMLESMLFPSAGISHNYESWTVVTVDGEVLNGLLISRTEQEIQLRDAEGNTRKVLSDGYDELRPNTLSLMPEGVHNLLNDQELADLVAWLTTLKVAEVKNDSGSDGARSRPNPAGSRADKDASRPNVLLAIADDWSFGHAGAYGCEWVRTPSFDRVAREGLLFTHAYTPSAKCAPSRACLLTGRNSWQLKDAANHVCYFPPEFKTWVEALGDAGYVTGHTEKGWGPGMARDIEGTPRRLTGTPFNEMEAEPPAGGMVNNDYAGNFEQFLDGTAENEPWCFWYGALEPHRRYEFQSGVSKGGKHLSDVDRVPGYWPDNETVRHDMLDYALEVEHFDSHLGRMIAELERRGMLENTLVIVTSDHGMPFPRDKGQAYQNSNHIPLAMMWKGKILAPGRSIDDLISLIDIAPTIVEAAGLEWSMTEMQETPGVRLQNIFASDRPGFVDDSRDHVLIGKERHDVGRPDDVGYPIRGMVTRDLLYLHNYETERWPAGNPETGYLNCDGSPTKTVVLNARRDGTAPQFWDACFGKRPVEELYDLQNDPDCISNLALNAEYAFRREQLSKQMKEELLAQSDPRMLGQGDYFDQIRYSNPRYRNFYNRFMSGEKIHAGWVNESDFETKPIDH